MAVAIGGSSFRPRPTMERMNPGNVIAALSLFLSVLSMLLSVFLAFRANSSRLYASLCFRSQLVGEGEEWFICFENTGPGTIYRLCCELDSGKGRCLCAMLPPGGDVVLTIRTPLEDPGLVNVSWSRPYWPFRIRVKGVCLSDIPLFKQEHHRSDFTEDENVVARIAEWSANEGDDRMRGPIRLTPSFKHHRRISE